jgi:hypothetical protein
MHTPTELVHYHLNGDFFRFREPRFSLETEKENTGKALSTEVLAGAATIHKSR